MRKTIVLFALLLLCGCSQITTEPSLLPSDEVLVIAHRGASAYAPAHTIAAYQLAIDMGANYIELDLHRTKDGKLVALHDEALPLAHEQQAVSDITMNELKLYSPGMEFNKANPDYASPTYNDLHIVTLDEILTHFGDTTNYYIELKSPSNYPAIEKELLTQLSSYGLLTHTEGLPKVIIQSFNADSLKTIFSLDPAIPLVQLYKFEEDAYLSKKQLQQIRQYASGIGVNSEAVTKNFIETMHNASLHVHPYTVNDPQTIYNMLMLGADGIFTDKPDLASQIKKEVVGK